MLVFFVACFRMSYTITVLESKSEFADVYCAFEEDLSAHALWQAVDEPAFVDVCICHVGSTTIME